MVWHGHGTPGWMDPDVAQLQELGEQDGHRRMRLHTGRGKVDVRLHAAPDAHSAALMVGGVGGGFDSPARDLYGRLASGLVDRGYAALRVQFRHPTALEESVHDVLAGVRALEQLGVRRVALLGHSFGGAVVATAGAASANVVGVVTLSTQSYGIAPIADLAPRPVLLVHGLDDEILPPMCSVHAHRIAGEPKELKLFEGARHGLDEVADAVFGLTLEWLVRHLAPPSSA
ncbi:MAG: alpha/beta hydrolase family protein [Myxococcales bacterium]